MTPSETIPDLEIEFRGGEMEPQADIVPEGPVRFQLINGTDESQNFALVALAVGHPAHREGSEPVGEDDIEVVGLIDEIPAHGAKSVTWPLVEGRYAMIANTRGRYLNTSIFELTVQPVEG